MAYLRPDEIAMFRRAIRAGHNVRKTGDVTDKMLVEMALNKCRESARDILKECYWRLRENSVSAQYPVVLNFFRQLAYEWTLDSDIRKRISADTLLEALDFVVERPELIGEDFAEYMKDCINLAKRCRPVPYDRSDIADKDDEYEQDWLGLSFNLRQNKHEGQPIDLELAADILDGMHHILAALEQPSDSHDSKLDEDLHRYEGGDLPSCINRLIRLKGYPYSVDVLAEKKKVLVTGMLMELASDLLNEIRRARGTIKGPLKFKRMASGNVFMKCEDLNVEQVEALLENSSYSESEKMSLRKRRETLRAYSSESLRKNNKSGNATGFDRLYRKHGHKLHSKIKRSATDRSAEFEAITADLKIRRKKKAAREHPIVRKAMEIIRSPGVGNHNRAELLKLQRHTPKDAQLVWTELWDHYFQRLQKIAQRSNFDL